MSGFRNLVKAGTVVASVLAAIATIGGASAEDVIKLGLLPSTTGPGAANGAAMTAGVELAVAEINKAGGVIGRQIKIIRGDTQSNPTTAAGEARRLIDREGVQILIGPAISQEAVPAVEVATAGKIVQVTNAGTTALTPKVGPYHFSFNTDIASAAKIIVDTLKDMGIQRVGLLADDGGQSRSGVAAIKANAAAAGLQITGEQEYHFRADDLSPQILSLRGAKPEAVIFFTSSVEDGAKMLKTLGEIGWQPKVFGATAISVFAPAIVRSTGPDAFANVYSVAYRGMTYCSGDAEGANKYAQFAKALAEFMPRSDKLSVSLASEYYDAVKLLAAGIAATGGTDGVALARWVETKGWEVPLIHGSISPSSESHFLFGDKELAMVERPHDVRVDGLMKRRGC
ncbi:MULTISPECIES: ABC transporter substrate-binding protein [unclassified Chelatococcus]|uniref:ABC transporter substrate-binding protein n=1 Tax=unclassified Chelatococcus TaxID=2638111 RepID=UPI001BCCC284|nr:MULTISPECIES: ABC transporter substrate-binding protein [unclassified Chelatococcus]MBS7701228.1 ABC transporter substrate-binding protein [Chelatococcus sp. YT9]